MRLVAQIALAVLLAFGLTEAHPAQRDNAQELFSLPEYCRYTWGNAIQPGDDGEGKRKYWRQRLGPELAHMHHYCYGLKHIDRARRSPLKERAKWYSASIPEIDYVIRAVSEDYVLMPEFLTRKGEALVYIKKFREADQTLQRAIELKPDYWPAYAQLAEGLIARKNLDAAREVLKQGVSRAQEPRTLQKMLDELDKPRQ